MPGRPIVLIHGYSDKGESFNEWKRLLHEKFGESLVDMPIANYKTLTNEVTIKDIAEGFDRALKLEAKLKDGQEFDAIVHSTGMLVIRSWLTTYAHRRSRLKHLIGLAPATFGSPLAHKGRSWFGAIFKGHKAEAPDFLESGDLVLDALELGSKFTWDLAHEDLLKKTYGPGNDTPYVFVFSGNKDKGAIVRNLGTGPGTDGTIRFAGMTLVTRKIVIDMTKDPAIEPEERFTFSEWTNTGSVPITFINNLDHTDVLVKPTMKLVELVHKALSVSNDQDLADYLSSPELAGLDQYVPNEKWQQFVFHAVDERGEGINDFNVQLSKESGGLLNWFREFETDVHVYSTDKSYRCFHVDVSNIDQEMQNSDVIMTVRARTRSHLVTYHGYSSNPYQKQGLDDRGNWFGTINISKSLAQQHKMFVPFRTTLVELRLNREPLPIDPNEPNKVCEFV